MKSVLLKGIELVIRIVLEAHFNRVKLCIGHQYFITRSSHAMRCLLAVSRHSMWGAQCAKGGTFLDI